MFASQGYGDATQQAPRAARQEEKHTCMPVTVRILQDAVAKQEGQDVLIHGVEASIVHLVGAVEGLLKQTAMMEFTVNDASGRMKVRFYGNMDSVAGIEDGRYVSITGNLRTSPSAHVSAMNLQPVASADEISYHMISVGHAALRLRNPTKAPGAMRSDPITPAKQSAGLGFGGQGSTLSPAKVAPGAAPVMAATMQTPTKMDLRSSVVDVLRQVQESGNETGLDISALLGRLAGAADASSEKVRSIISQLVDDGEVFTTIDDDHFSMI